MLSYVLSAARPPRPRGADDPRLRQVQVAAARAVTFALARALPARRLFLSGLADRLPRRTS